jgi:aryl-alcohol dehydrogenase-like predicted oxidoreductase
MRYRPFGRTGWQVSEIGLGTWGMGSMWGASDDGEAIRAIRRALDLGVNVLDSAAVYGQGHAEEVVGQALAGASADVYVATKITPLNMEWPARDDAPVDQVYPAAWIRRCTEQSLRRLARPAIDLQQLHVWSPRWLAQSDRWLPAVERLKRDGKIRAFGISINDHQPDSALELVASGLIDSVQVIYNLFEQSPAERLFPQCQRHRVAVIARVPFDEGSLAGGFTPQTTFPEDDWRADYFAGDRLRQTVERVERLRPLVQRPGRTMAQGALVFCLSHPAVSTVIPGMRRTAHVDANCAAVNSPAFTTEDLATLGAHAWLRNFYRQEA